MTDGSSQGLFVIVALVIFGIFVVISYLLFRDKLQTGLASIFTDSIKQSSESVVPFTKLNTFKESNSTYVYENQEYTINVVNSATGEYYPSGLRSLTGIKINYNEKIIFQYDVYYEGSTEIYASVDLNAFTEKPTDAWNTSDNFGSISTQEDSTNQYYVTLLKPNQWNTVTVWYINDNVLNVNKLPIFETTTQGTVLGIQKKGLLDNNIKTFKMRNIQYKIVNK